MVLTIILTIGLHFFCRKNWVSWCLWNYLRWGQSWRSQVSRPLVPVTPHEYHYYVDPLGVLESVKAAADIYAPVGGTVTEVNPELGNSPSLVNESPYETGEMLAFEGTNLQGYDIS